MRQTIKQVLTLAAFFLASTAIWAESTITVTKQINGDGIGETDPGTVTHQATDGTCTITVTPTKGFYVTADNIAAYATVSGHEAQSTQRSATPNINEGKLEVTAKSGDDPSGVTTYAFTMPTDGSNVEITVDFQSCLDISKATITLESNAITFTGEAVEPAVSSVTLGNETISADNYTVTYSDNTNVGTATVTITGTRIYTGTATTTFEITKAAAAITKAPAAVSGLTYSGAAQTLISAGTVTGGTLQYSTDNKTFSTELPQGTDAGDYNVYYKVEGDANHTGLTVETPITVNIASKALESSMATLEATSVIFSGQAQTPAVTVKDGETTLVEKTDYTLTYKNNTNIGTATVTVTGRGNYTGTVDLTFTIIENVAEEISKSFGENKQFCTFASQQTLTVPTGIKAYVVTGINLNSRQVTTKEVSYLPKGVPVLLEKTGTEIGAASLYTGVTSDVSCILQSSGENGTTVADNSTTSYYILYKDEYVKVTRGTTIAANKYYLTATGTNAPSRLVIIGSNSDVTAIKSITNNSLTTGDNIIYDLQGRRILHPAKGQLYIANGKKVVLK